MNDISSQVSELKSSIASAEQQQKQELQERIAEVY
jgi:outer membrane murein-binding lipoprotein Lpp